MYIEKYLFLIDNIDHIFFSWVLLCPLIFSGSIQKFKFSMNFFLCFFFEGRGCFDFLIYLLDVNQSYISTSCSYSTFTLKFYLEAYMYFIRILTLS